MGLKEFDIAPDNTGGRPEGTEEGVRDGSTRRFWGEAIPSDPSEIWWNTALRRACDGVDNAPQYGGELSSDFMERAMQISALSSYVALQPINTRKKMDEHGFFSTDWELYKEKAPEHWVDSRVPGVGSESGGGESEEEPGSGLSSIINASK